MKTHLGTYPLLLAGLLLTAGCGGGPESAPAGDQPGTTAVVYSGARLIPGDGTAPVETGALVVDEGVILDAGPADAVAAPDGARVVDLSGQTLIPALVNLHGHVGFQRGLTYDAANYTRANIEDHLQRYAYHGIGVIVSMGTDAGELWREIQRDQAAGQTGGARLFTAGRGLAAPMAGPGAAALRPSAAGVTSEDEGRALVAELAGQGVSFIKIWVDDRGGTVEKLAPAYYRAIIEAAHQQGLDVIAHVFYHEDAEDLAAAGVDGFAHLVRDREMDDALVAAIVEQDVFRHAQPGDLGARPAHDVTSVGARTTPCRDGGGRRAGPDERRLQRTGPRRRRARRAVLRADGTEPRQAARRGRAPRSRVGFRRAGVTPSASRRTVNWS